MPRVIDLGRRHGLRHFLFGSTEETLARLEERLLVDYPGAKIVGRLSPPISAIAAEVGEEALTQISAARPHLVWCALGAPKQEQWMHANSTRLAPALVLGVGAAFDFLAETKHRAPRWMRRAGLEWLHRLISEPRRLSSRYLRTNTSFLLLAARMLRQGDCVVEQVDGSNGHLPTDSPIDPILPLLGHSAAVLHGIAGSEGEPGGDFDCVVNQLDPLWPLRLPAGWTLCQRLPYDVKSTHWILDHYGSAVAVDTIDDPHGIGKYGFPTGQAVSPAVRGAYLTAKRIRKNDRNPNEWGAIRSLASTDPAVYARSLRLTFGRRLARPLAASVLRDAAVPDSLWRRAHRYRRQSLLLRPDRLVHLAFLQAFRVADRIRHPTGFHVVVAGPDGSGKSTLADEIPHICEGFFRRTLRLHWRPGLLPRVGLFLSRDDGDITHPHDRAPHGRMMSSALLLYYWLDFALGGVLRVQRFKMRTGLVIVERGWWDILVDPLRYRLAPSRVLVRLLGRLTPQPDLILLLDAPAAEIRQRKNELTAQEIARQLVAWRSAVPAHTRASVISGDVAAMKAAARREIVAALEERTISRLGGGWFSLPLRSEPRWTLPRSPRRLARAALRVYNPVTVRARVGWQAGRAAASVGAGRTMPRSTLPLREIRALVGPYLPPGGSFAVSTSVTHANRHVLLLLDDRGHERAIAKVALDEVGRRRLSVELASLERWGHLLSAPLRAPDVLASEEQLLLLEAVPWRVRVSPWRLEPEVAEALGRFHALTGAAHGDCAPWNLLRTADGWVLIDWEDAIEAAAAFHDLFHFLLRSSRLLGSPSAKTIAAGLSGAGWVGRAISAYAAGADLDPHGVTAAFIRHRVSASLSSASEPYGCDFDHESRDAQ